MEYPQELEFHEAIGLYKQGCRIKSLVTGRTYIDYKHDGENTKFKLSEIYGKWMYVE
jgi:hypothetical protein